MTINLFSTYAKLFFLSLFFGLLFTSCGDDEEVSECEGLAVISSDLMMNGSSASLSIAQLLVSDAFDETSYQFQIAGTLDCEELKTASFVITIPSGESIDGTYNFVDFFSAGAGDSHGSIFNQNLTTLSQSSSDIDSGSVTVTENGESNFTLDISAQPVQGATLEMELTHQF